MANGRVNSIAVDPTDSNVLYLGSAGGGVWRSDNGGVTWRPLTDQQPTLGIGSSHAIAVDPNNHNTVYAGTTNFALLAQSQPRPIDYSQSKGVLKSTDGGTSWIVLGSGIPSGNSGNALSLFSKTEITTIIVDPADSNTLYLAAGRGGTVAVQGGLFRSTDGGAHWTQGTGGTGIVESLVLDTSSPPASRVLYAGVNGVGVLKSTDGGQSWSAVLTPATAPVAAAAPNGFWKVMASLAPTSAPPDPDGQVVYATVLINSFCTVGHSPCNQDSDCPSGTCNVFGTGLVFENTKGGAPANWVKKNALVVHPPSTFFPLAGGAFSDMVVDPASPGDGAHDLIYWGGQTQYLSTDSGDTFNEIGQIHGTHGDAQTFLVVPKLPGPSIVYEGDDGGIWKSTDQGATWTGTNQVGSPATINAGGLQTGLFYALAVKQDATASVTLGGVQDNGRLRTAGTPTWTGTADDGVDVVFDHVTTGDAYAAVNCGSLDCILKSTNSGSTWPTDITPTAIMPDNERYTFQNRLAMDPSHAGYLYVGGSSGSVFQTRTGGTTFRSLGTPAPGKYVSSLDVAPTDSNSLVIAANDIPLDANAVSNNVSVTTNALAPSVTFVDITRKLPRRFVTRVAFDPNDSTVIYATLAGFGSSTPAKPGHVYKTTIGGTAWTDISPPIDVPVDALALDGTSTPAVIYIGTDVGVLRTLDGGASWVAVDNIHLPNAAVSDLKLNLLAGVLRAATFGRGVFELAAPTGPAISVAQVGLGAQGTPGAPGDLAFGETCPKTGADLPIDASNLGTRDLVINSVQRIAGSANFTVLGTPSTPLTIAPGGKASFTVHFTPTLAGPVSALIEIASTDPQVPVLDLVATGMLDATAPTLSCSDITVANDLNQCGAIVNFPLPNATDSCPVTVTTLPPPGSFFPVGTTPVVGTATDSAGNMATCGFNVTVIDTENPQISCPHDITVLAPNGTSVVVNYPAPTATDNCPGVKVVSLPASGSTFAVGNTVVTATATDAHGNMATCTFNVFVYPPIPTLSRSALAGLAVLLLLVGVFVLRSRMGG
ncbi:MAG: HYR domain-containing protein [Thermoanaerobaculales bacterium]